MIITTGDGFNLEIVKSELERWKKATFGEESPALFVVPELKFKAKEILHGTGIPWKVIYWPSSQSAWFIMPSYMINKIEPTDSWIPQTNQGETIRYHYRRYVPKSMRKFLGRTGIFKWAIFTRRFNIT